MRKLIKRLFCIHQYVLRNKYGGRFLELERVCKKCGTETHKVKKVKHPTIWYKNWSDQQQGKWDDKWGLNEGLNYEL